MRLDAAARSDPGPRARNEDRVLCLPERRLFAVADGVGGLPRGDRAATLLVEALERHCVGEPDRKLLEDSFLDANAQMLQESSDLGLARSMGTVATAAWMHADGRVLIGHIGNTRALRLFPSGALEQLTADHVGYDESGWTEAESLYVPNRNVIGRCLGLGPLASPEGQVDVLETRLLPGESLVLCSDGISDMVDRLQLALLLKDTNQPATVLLERVLGAALEAMRSRGHGDNASLVVVRIGRVNRNYRPVLWGSAAVLLLVMLLTWLQLQPPQATAEPLAATVAAWCQGWLHNCDSKPVKVVATTEWVDLGGRWPPVALTGEGAWKVTSTGPVLVSKTLIFQDLQLRSEDMIEIHVDPGASLTLRGGGWEGKALHIQVGAGAFLVLESLRLDLTELRIFPAEGAQLRFADVHLRPFQPVFASLDGFSFLLTRSSPPEKDSWTLPSDGAPHAP